MDEELYKGLKDIANNEGKSIYDVTNDAIEFYISLYKSLRDEISYVGTYYLLLNHLLSVSALSINKTLITPNDLSLLISNYISMLSPTEEGKINRLFTVFDFIVKLFRGSKAINNSSDSKQVAIYKFDNESDSSYFRDFSYSLIRKIIGNSNVKYSVDKSDLLVKIEIEEK